MEKKQKITLLHIAKDHLINYPTPSNLSYFWNFGFLSGICLTIQLISGIFLAMHYTPEVNLAFSSVEHIMRDVNNGWFFRYLHANGASAFFVVLYTHIGRGVYYRSYTYPRSHIWYSGITLYILVMATAFLGYVLPWGQMSYWGATVITNLFSAIPIVGSKIAFWLWGGFSVSNATLNRFFVLHFLLPFVIAGGVLLHIALLHKIGSNNPLGLQSYDSLSFYPYFVIKDIFGLFLFMLVLLYFVYFEPNTLGHPDNYIRANPQSTPAHIVPEWYFLPFYAILRAVPNKLGGVVLMGGAIATLYLLPTIDKDGPFTSPRFRPLFRFFFWLFVVAFLLLGFLGAQPVEEPFTAASVYLTIFYFAYFFIITPAIGYFELCFYDFVHSNPEEPKEKIETVEEQNERIHMMYPQPMLAKQGATFGNDIFSV